MRGDPTTAASPLGEPESGALADPQRLAERATLLVATSSLLSASLNYEETVAAVARVTVPKIADWCSVDIVANDGSIEPAAVAHVDPAREAWAWELRSRYPTRPEEPAGVAKVIRSGSSELLPDISDAALRALAQDDLHLRILRAVGLRSAIIVPLRARGETLGALSLLSAGSGHRYDADDLALAEELATRCALAVDNARLYRAAREREVEARESEERFRLLVEGVSGYAILMLEPDGRVASWNAGAERIYGYRADEILGHDFARFYADEAGGSAGAREALRVAGERGRYDEEGWRIRKDGSRFHASAVTTALHDEAGHLRGFSKITRDITERKRLEDQLNHQALHDPLTGLPNRTLFIDHVEQARRRAKRSHSVTAVLFVDLDRFKPINDSLGHAAGDEVLRSVAARLNDAVRETDTVARLGGDEFTVLCEDIGPTGAITVSERIISAVAEPIELDDQDLYVGASVGIGLAEGGSKSAGTLLREADSAMYEAKHGGRAHYVIFDERLRARAAKRLQTEVALRRGIEQGELRLHYQPLIDVASGKVVGVEALVRWQQNGALKSPAEFISLAEDTGLILALGARVLEKACRQAARWNRQRNGAGPLTVAVNVSAAELSERDFVERLETILSTTGAEPAHLCLELTESGLMHDAEAATAQLQALGKLGVRLAIDDFGTGYSSLAYLSRFPVDVVKIDRAFVDGLAKRANDRALVAAITSMGHALELTVIGEGVETQEQLDVLRELRCDVAQGYHFAHPAPAEAIGAMLSVPA